ncbi:hypothetical protein [Aneurinibacillus tyrosinisolvens]|uniref:hypothetical protein n=1 Tax=Aneurinibacillus tyrosinisolvens TaxID=1443435 RepID=UPI00063F7B93|nr:hypothetical protein [Aneurinibacillus tyrosinisolvens]
MASDILQKIDGHRFYCTSLDVQNNDPNTFDTLVESFPDESTSDLESGNYIVEYYFGHGVMGIRAAQSRDLLLLEEGFSEGVTGKDGLRYEEVPASPAVLKWYAEMVRKNGQET